jgi:hypothetical protein
MPAAAVANRVRVATFGLAASQGAAPRSVNQLAENTRMITANTLNDSGDDGKEAKDPRKPPSTASLIP